MPRTTSKQHATHIYSILNLNSKQFTLLPHSEGLFSPQWSPNGRYVVAKPQSQPKLLLFDCHSRVDGVLSPVGLDFPLWSNDSETFISMMRIAKR